MDKMPPGTYNAQLSNVVLKNGTCKITFRITDGKYAGKELESNLMRPIRKKKRGNK